MAKGIFNRKASELVSDRGPVRPPGLLGLHQLWGCKKDGAKSGGEGWQMGGGEGGGCTEKRGGSGGIAMEPSRSRLGPQVRPSALSQVPHLWES